MAIDRGTIHIADSLVDDGNHRVPPERWPAGLVFQEHALFPHLSVADNVGFGLRDMDYAAVATRVREMLELVSLDAHGDRYPTNSPAANGSVLRSLEHRHRSRP